MKKIFLAAIIAVFTLVNVSTSNADLVLDFNGGSVTQSDGTIINYTVTRTNGTLTGVPAEGIFDADEIDDDNPFEYTIDFGSLVDFTVSPTPGPGNLGNSGDNQGVLFTSNTGVFDASGVVGATIGGNGTNALQFNRENGGATSGSAVDFGSFTVAGTTQIIAEGLGGGSNREAFVFTIADSVGVPEPGSLVVLSLGSLALLVRRRR